MTDWARCNFDGRPLSPGDRQVMADFAATLAAHQADPALRWRERAGGDSEHGPYWQDWYCPPPPLRRSWQVVPGCEEWAPPGPDGIAVRRIYAIDLAP